MNDNRKRKADESADYRKRKVHVLTHGGCHDSAVATFVDDLVGMEGDRKEKPEEYCSWPLLRVKSSDRWAAAL